MFALTRRVRKMLVTAKFPELVTIRKHQERQPASMRHRVFTRNDSEPYKAVIRCYDTVNASVRQASLTDAQVPHGYRM
jgi:hypothetical protein